LFFQDISEFFEGDKQLWADEPGKGLLAERMGVSKRTAAFSAAWGQRKDSGLAPPDHPIGAPGYSKSAPYRVRLPPGSPLLFCSPLSIAATSAFCSSDMLALLAFCVAVRPILDRGATPEDSLVLQLLLQRRLPVWLSPLLASRRWLLAISRGVFHEGATA
jgi:hypothetical protein